MKLIALHVGSVSSCQVKENNEAQQRENGLQLGARLHIEMSGAECTFRYKANLVMETEQDNAAG